MQFNYLNLKKNVHQASLFSQHFRLFIKILIKVLQNKLERSISVQIQLLRGFFFFHFISFLSAAVILFIPVNNYLIMTSIDFLSQRQSNYLNNDSNELHKKISSLEQQIDQLNQIIVQKDIALEEIKQAYNNSKIKHAQYKQNQAFKIKIIQKSNFSHLAIDDMHLAVDDMPNNFELQRVNQIVFSILQELQLTITNCFSKSAPLSQQNKRISTNASKSKRLNIQKDGEEHDTSIQGQQVKRIYQVPITMQLLKEMTDIDVQVDINPSKSFVYQVPIEMLSIEEFPIQIGQVNFDSQIKSQQRKLYELPIQMLQIFQIPVDLKDYYQMSLDLQLSSEGEQKKIIWQNPIQMDINKQEIRKLTSQISILLDQITILKEQNLLIKAQKQIIKVVQLPIDIIQVVQIPIELQMPQKDIKTPIELQLDQSHASKQFYNLLRQLKRSPKNIVQPNVSAKALKQNEEYEFSVELAFQNQTIDSTAQTQQTGEHKPRIIKIPQIKYVQIPIEASHTIKQKTQSEIPMLKTGQIGIKNQANVMEQYSQTEQLTSNQSCKLNDCQTQTAQSNDAQSKIVKIPYIKCIQVPVETEKIVQKIIKIPIIKEMQVPYQTQKLVQKVVYVQNTVYVEKIEYVEKVVQKVKLIEIPIQVEVNVPIVKQVPIEVVIERQVIKYVEKEDYSREKSIIVREIPIQIVIQKIVEVPKVIQKIKLVQVPIQVEIIKQVEVIKQVIKEVEVIKYIQKVQHQIQIRENPIQKPQLIVESPIQVVLDHSQASKQFYNLLRQLKRSPKNIVQPNASAKALKQNEEYEFSVELAFQNQTIDSTAQTQQTGEHKPRIIKIPQIKYVQIPIEASHTIKQKTQSEIPMLKTAQIGIKNQANVMEQYSQTEQLTSNESCRLNDCQTQTAQSNDAQSKIVKIPYIKCIQVPVETEKIVQKIIKIPIIKEMQVPYQTQKLIQKVVYVQNTVYVEKIEYVEKVVQKVKLIEIPIQVEVNVPIVKQVPIEVVIERQVIKYVEKEDYSREKSIIVREIPIQIVIQKIVEVPKVIQKIKLVQVPIQVEIIKQVEVIKQVIKEVEVIKYIQKVQHQIQIREIPIQVVVERIINVPIIQIREIPIEVLVQKIVIREIPIQIQIPKEIYIQKIVRQQIIKQITVQKIVVCEIPVQVFIQRDVQVIIQKQKIIKVQVPIIQQVPVVIYLQAQKIKQVKTIVQIPVFVMLQPNKSQEQQISSLGQQSTQKLQILSRFASNINDQQIKKNQTNEIQCKVFQLPIQLEVQKIVEVQRIKQIYIQVPVVHEVTVQIIKEIQKLVYIEKIVEKIKEKQVLVQKIIQVPVQYIIQVPIYIQIQKQIEKIVYRDRLIQIPIQLVLQNQQIQSLNINPPLTLKIQSVYEIKQMNTKFSSEIKMSQIPVSNINPSLHCRYTQIMSQQSLGKRLQNQDNTCRQNKRLIQKELKLVKDENQDFVVEIDCNQLLDKYDQIVEFQLNFPFNEYQEQKKQIAIQTEKYQQQQASIAKGPSSKMSIDLMKLEYQAARIQQQLRHRDYLKILKQKYDKQIKQLHSLIMHLQTIMKENNQQKQCLKQQIQQIALRQSLVQNQCEKLKILLFNNEQQLQQLQKIVQAKQKIEENLKEQLFSQQNKLKSENVQQQIQTQEIDLFETMQVIEIPVNMLEVNKINLDQDNYGDEDDLKLNNIPLVLKNHPSPEYKFNSKFVQSQFAQSSNLRNNLHIFEIPVQVIISDEKEKNIGYQQIEYNNKNIQAQTKRHYFSTLMQTQDYNNIIEKQYNNRQVQVQIQNQIIATKIYQDTQIQTDSQQNLIFQQHIYEVPMQFVQLAEKNQAQTQTEINSLNNDIKQSENNQINILLQKNEFKSKKSYLSQYQSQENECIKTEQYSKLKQSSNQNKQIQKHFTEYYPSRIFEVPIQINVLPISIELPKQNISTICQTEATNCSIYKLINVHKTFVSPHVKEAASTLQIVSGIESITIFPERQESPNKQGRMQSKICRLGSDLTLNVMHYSNVQSMTPGRMDGSMTSYDKFPVPNIQIHNISVIKKDSFSSENRFFGSLNMRQQLMSRQDPIHSIRLANKRLTGFEQESSDGDDPTTSREMVIQQNESLVTKDLIRIQTPNLEPHDLNFSQYANLQQKNYQLEQQKPNYQQINQNLHSQILSLKKQIQNYRQQINQIKINHFDQQLQLNSRLQDTQLHIAALAKEKQLLQFTIQQCRCRLIQSDQSKNTLQKNNQILLQNYQRLKQQSQKHQRSAGIQLQRLRGIIDEKMIELREVKSEQINIKKHYQHQLNQFKDIVTLKNQEIYNLQEQLQHKNDEIDQLESALEEMRKNIALMRQDQQVDPAAIYQQQFQRIKYSFQEEKRQMLNTQNELKFQIERLNAQLFNQQKKSHSYYETIQSLKEEIQNFKHQNSKLHHLKSEVQNHYMENVKQLNDQIEGMKDIIRQKEQIIVHKKVAGHTFVQNESHFSKIKMQYISTQSSRIRGQNKNNYEEYCKKLQFLILKYQEMLVTNHNTIQQLQEKVCQYLRDALDKQHQAENLYVRIVDFQNTTNNLLVDKVTLQLDNRRLTKSIQQSQKKLKILGNRLIEVARQRADYQSEEEDYYYE